MAGRLGRRGFTAICLSAVAAALQRPARGAPPTVRWLTQYDPVLLTTASGEPLHAGSLDPEEEYIFFYPFASTPCLLLDLGRPTPGTEVTVKGGAAGYVWGGGVGPGQSIVAFTAICPHQWTHPERTFSPIGYHRSGQPAAVAAGRDRLIVCCAHGSAFAPEAGGHVEQGPADVPLAAILITWDREGDRFFADGLVGPNSFEPFFRSFRGKSQVRVEGQTLVMRLREYSAVVARC